MIAAGGPPLILQTWFYVLSLATLVISLTTAAWRFALHWARDRVTWEENLKATKEVAQEVRDLRDDMRATQRRIDRLDKRLTAVER